VLHGILVEPPISIVGLSNWVLDPAKMNRSLCVQRPDPSEQDVRLTGERILGGGGGGSGGGGGASSSSSASSSSASSSSVSGLGLLLESLSRSYTRLYDAQNARGGRGWIGMRDFYQLLKLLKQKAADAKQGGADAAAGGGGWRLSTEALVEAICRNFGGKPGLLREVLDTFEREHTTLLLRCQGGSDTAKMVAAAAICDGCGNRKYACNCGGVGDGAVDSGLDVREGRSTMDGAQQRYLRGLQLDEAALQAERSAWAVQVLKRSTATCHAHSAPQSNLLISSPPAGRGAPGWRVQCVPPLDAGAGGGVPRRPRGAPPDGAHGERRGAVAALRLRAARRSGDARADRLVALE